MSTYNEYHVGYNRRLPTFFFSPLFQQLSCITRRRHRQVSLSLEALADFFLKPLSVQLLLYLPLEIAHLFFELFLAQRLTHMRCYGRVLGEWCEWDGLRIIAGHIYANEETQCTWGDYY